VIPTLPPRPLRFLVLLLVLLLVGARPLPAQAPVQVHWLGHSAFMIVSPGGTRVLIDPFPPEVGYSVRKVPAEDVMITSNLFDHKYVAMAEGNPRVLHGLTREGEWTRLRADVGDFRIRALPSWQDNEKGAIRGKNSMFLLETGGLRLLHAGNLGHDLDERTRAELGRLDLFMVPVGGIYTLDGKQAAAVVRSLAPRVAVPMHFKTPALRFQLQPPTKFLSQFPDFQKAKSLSLTRDTPPPPTKVFLLDYLR